MTPGEQRQRLLRVVVPHPEYCPQWPHNGFASLEDARGWVRDFIHWYNNEHHHSRINFVTPAQRHQGRDTEVLAKRHQLYREARERTPERWSGDTRNWKPSGPVKLNPERDEMMEKLAA